MKCELRVKEVFSHSACAASAEAAAHTVQECEYVVRQLWLNTSSDLMTPLCFGADADVAGHASGKRLRLNTAERTGAQLSRPSDCALSRTVRVVPNAGSSLTGVAVV